MSDGSTLESGRFFRDRTDATLARAHFSFSSAAQAASLVAGLLLLLALLPVVPWPWLAFWYALLAASVGNRVWIASRFRRSQHDEVQLARAVRRLRWGFAGSGAAWGAAAFLTWPGFSLAHQGVIALFQVGYAAAVIVPLSMFRGMYPALAVPALLPSAGVFLSRGTLNEAALGVAMLYGLAIFQGLHVKLRGMMRRHVELRDELDEAVTDLETVADSVPVGIVYLDRDLTYDYCNRQYAALLRRPKEEIEGRSLREVTGESAYRRTLPHIKKALAGEIVHYEVNPDAQGLTGRTFDIRYVPDCDASGEVRGLFAVVVDITDYRRTEHALATEKELAQTTLEAVAEGVIRAGVDGAVRYVNPAACEITGWAADDAVGRSLHEILPAWDSAARHAAGQIARIAGGRGERYEPQEDLWLTRPDGSRAWLGILAQPLRGAGDEIEQMVIIIRDRTQARRVMDELSYRAAHDALTGLLNRRELETRLQRAAETASHTGHGHALLMLDLDGFKQVNDAAGHLVGDRVLVRIANTLRRKIRRDDVVARLGGDEFAVLLRDANTAEAEGVGRKLIRAVRQLSLDWRGTRYQVGASVGVAPLDGSRPVAEVMQAADDACYDAKRAGRGCVRHARDAPTAGAG